MTRVAPVSGLQRGLWFLDRWNPGAATYNIPWIFELVGPLDLGLLERSLGAVFARHEALRTTFALHTGGPQQLVHAPTAASLAVTDLRDLPEAERRERAEAAVAAEAAAPFDLERGPLVRASALRHGDEATTVVIVVHHIVWDGWSAGVFERELAEIYTASVEGRTPVLPELTTQYADYAVEEEAASFEEHLTHWKRELDGAPMLLELPGDRPRPSTRSHRGHTEHFGLPTGLAGRVRELAEAEGVTPFMVELAAFAVLLNRYTGAEDMVIGTPVTTRNRPELEDLVGYFVNLLPLRVRLDATTTFRDLLQRVQDTAFDAFAYLDVPFDQIVDQLALDRSAQHPPLVQVVFGAHAEDHEPLRFGPAAAHRQVRSNGTTKFDLTWSVFDDGELRGEVEYSTDLFDAETVRRMAGDWQDLLTAALDDCDRTVLHLTAPDAAQASYAPVSVPAGRCLHELFEEAADAHGGRTAVSDATRALTYTELDRAANRLAHALVASGVRPGDRVGLLMDRTADILVSVLAVLKTGAAYVPVDLTAPAGRAAMVFGDTGVALVVTDRPDRVPEGPWTTYELAARAQETAGDAGAPARHRRAARRRGVRDLHLGLHRPPQGRRGRARTREPH